MRTLHAATLLFSLCVLVPLAAPADLFRVDEDDDDDEEPLPDLGVADIDVNATTEKGKYLGSPCEFTCNSNLHHVYCNSITERCECEKKFPVKLGPTRGCAKPKRLGEQCYYTHTCSFNDPHASCIQVNHNAVCQCKAGFHIVTLQRPYKRVFCAEDLVLLTTDLSALAGVATGIAILAGLICFVLRLFSQARYSRPRHFANANMAPPILFSSETGSRRPSIASIHSAGSLRSFGNRMYDREKEQKEQRHEMQIRLARMSSLPSPLPKPTTTVPTPSPLSTDELLPSVAEIREVTLAMGEDDSSSLHGEIGPCSSKDCC